MESILGHVHGIIITGEREGECVSLPRTGRPCIRRGWLVLWPFH